MTSNTEKETSVETPLRKQDLLTRLMRARPLLLASLLFLTGCILQFALNAPTAPLWAAMGVLLAMALLLRSRRGTAIALLMLTFIPAGMLRFDAAWRAVEPLQEQQSALITGRICENPEYREEKPRSVCTLNECSINGESCHGKLLLYLRGDTYLLTSVEYGQEVQVIAHLRPFDEATNPGQFNLSNYRRSQGLRAYATADISKAEFNDTPLRLSDIPEKIRAMLSERIDRLFPHNAPLARALVLGDRSKLAEEERERYARSGAAHLLAISGMHLSALAMLISMLLRHFMRRDHAFLLTLSLLICYGILIGFVPSLTRALIMYAILGFAPIAGRYSDSPTRLGAALLIHLFCTPTAILDTGFVLSYGATAGILLLSTPLSRLPPLDSLLNKRHGFGSQSKRIMQPLAGTVCMTIAAQLAILPAVVHFYGAQPVWSLLTNLLAAPLTMIAYAFALVGTLLNLTPIAAIADVLFGVLGGLVKLIAELPFAQLRVARFPLWLDGLCALICLAASELSRLPKHARRWLPFAVLLAIPLSNFLSWCTTQGVSVVFLDAGQADCAVIRAEGQVYMIDAGDTYSPAADYLSAMNYEPEALFITHPHADHAGGLSDMLTLRIPKRIYLSSNWENFEISEELTESLSHAEELGSQVIHISAGDEIELSEHVMLRVLSPRASIAADTNEADPNEDSLILRLEYEDARALFLADAPSLVTEGLAGDIDLLKVAHHGARDGTSAILLEETSPSAAVISVGRGNSYGHPVRRVLDLLDAAGAETLRTDLSGAVSCWLEEDGTLELREFMPTQYHEIR